MKIHPLLETTFLIIYSVKKQNGSYSNRFTMPLYLNAYPFSDVIPFPAKRERKIINKLFTNNLLNHITNKYRNYTNKDHKNNKYKM